jgi:hypothetical protein
MRPRLGTQSLRQLVHRHPGLVAVAVRNLHSAYNHVVVCPVTSRRSIQGRWHEHDITASLLQHPQVFLLRQAHHHRPR